MLLKCEFLHCRYLNVKPFFKFFFYIINLKPFDDDSEITTNISVAAALFIIHFIMIIECSVRAILAWVSVISLPPWESYLHP
jgi:hypothetical protein